MQKVDIISLVRQFFSDSIRIRRITAITQIAVGTVALILVIVTYISYAQKSRMALRELDGMAENAETELGIAVEVVSDLDDFLADVGKTFPSHKKTISSAIKSSENIANSVKDWKVELHGFSKISTDASEICDTFSSQLPIKIPLVKIETKRIRFELPEITPKTKSVSIKYPSSASVKTKRKSLSVPTGITVENKDYSAKILNKKIGFSYPSRIRVDKSDASFDYPSSIEIKEKTIKFDVPTTPTIKMKDYSFDIPDKLEITHRDLMDAEKKLLQETSKRLKSVSESLSKTQATLNGVDKMLREETITSLRTTQTNLGSAEETLSRIRTERIPVIVSRLSEQKKQLHSSRKVFSAIEGLIPLSALIFALIPLGMIISGVGKFYTFHEKS